MKLPKMQGTTSAIRFNMPADLRKALAADPDAQEQWRNITPLMRRGWIAWIITAKKAETRTRRVEKACNMLSCGKRRVCCFGGVNWLMKMSKEGK